MHNEMTNRSFISNLKKMNYSHLNKLKQNKRFFMTEGKEITIVKMFSSLGTATKFQVPFSALNA